MNGASDHRRLPKTAQPALDEIVLVESDAEVVISIDQVGVVGNVADDLETGIAPFGSEVYSKEELVAEFCAALLCNESGIENTIDNSAAYINGWAKVLRKDKRLVVTAASQGQRAADFIIGS